MTTNRSSPPSVQVSVRFVCEEERDRCLPPSLSSFCGCLFCAAGPANTSCEVTLYNLDVFQGLVLRVTASTSAGDGQSWKHDRIRSPVLFEKNKKSSDYASNVFDYDTLAISIGIKCNSEIPSTRQYKGWHTEPATRPLFGPLRPFL